MSLRATLRYRLGVVLAVSGFVLPLGWASSLCVLGLLPLAWGLGRLVAVLLDGARAAQGVADTEAATPNLRAGTFALVWVGLIAAASGGTALLVDELFGKAVPLWAVGGLSLIASGAAGAALFPLAFSPFCAADGHGGPREAVARSFAVAARLPMEDALALGARAGLSLGGGLVLAALVFASNVSPARATVAALMSGVIGIIPGPALLYGTLAGIYARAPLEGRGGVDVGPQLRRIATLLAPMLAAVGVALGVAAATPVPMNAVGEDPISRGVPADLMRWVSAAPRRVDGTSLSVRLCARGVLVEADDGGGTGVIDGPTGEHRVLLTQTLEEDGMRVHRILVSDGSEWWSTRIDDDGVRLDDSVARRVFTRLGLAGGTGLAASLLALSLLLWRVGRRLGEARWLDAPQLSEPGKRDASLAALPGTLRLSEGAQLSFDETVANAPSGSGGTLLLEGDAWFESSQTDLRFRLPPITPLLGEPDAQPPNEDAVGLLLSRFRGLSPRAIRDGSAAWPDDGVLSFRSLDEAAGTLLKATQRETSGLGAIALTGFVVCLIALVSALV